MSFFEQLAAEFPRGAISWRAQTVTKDGTKAMALAYIDARDVMDRLDTVCGPENWQDRYEFHGARTICYLSIRVDGEWITKADGAGDSDVEAEKGAISDALKRSAVKWGIGRYLYHIESPWVPCEVGQNNKWKRWTADPWDFVRKPKQQAQTEAASTPARSPDAELIYSVLVRDMKLHKTTADLARWWKDPECIDLRKKLPDETHHTLHEAFKKRGLDMKAKEERARAVEDDIQDQFPGSQIVNETHKEAAE